MKLQSAAPATAALHAAPAGLSDDPEKSLLDSLAGLAGERALILGLNIEIMCGLIQRGCRAVTEVEPGDRPEAASVELVIAPSVGTVEVATQAITQAKRGLTAFGRIVVRTARAPAESLCRSIPEILHRHGFSVLEVTKTGERTAFVAELSPAWSLAGE
jgi:hypothetical protein